VRVVVASYRQPRLESELEGARQLLSAAGIDVKIEPLGGTLPLELSAVLAWTVREGVTNVVRHSRAQHCLIRLTQEHETVGVEVINDGGREVRAASAFARSGLGLAGLAERANALGGRMEASTLPLPNEDRFRLWVGLPLQSGVKAERGQEEQP
jgi:two-component system sensor histidine kinase DesK